MFHKILLAFDSVDGSDQTLAAAVDLARVYQAELWVLVVEKHLPRYPATVGEVDEAKERADQLAHMLLSRAYLQALQAGIPFQGEVRSGSPGRTILTLASTGHFDLLIVGTTSPVRMWQVMQQAPCSILLVK